MTIEELRERIKNQIVLHDGELTDWQWPATGLPAEATELGITDFRRLVNDVSRQLNSYFGRILDLKEKIAAQARKQQKKLSNGDIDDIVKEAERLTLSKGFVADQWIPAILKTIPESSVASSITSATAPPYPTSLAPTPKVNTPVQPLQEPSNIPQSTPPADVSQKVKDILDDYDRHIPVQALRTLFRAIGGDENSLAETVRTYLSANFFSAETEPKGDSLKDKLLSTDWRHLSWWESQAAASVTNAPTVSQPEAIKTTQPTAGHPMVDQNYQAPPVPPGPVRPSTPPRTNLSGLWGVLFAVVFLLIVYWLVKGSGVADTEKKPTTVEQPKTPTKARSSGKKRRSEKVGSSKTDRAATTQKPKEEKPVVNKPVYEELRDEVGDYGEQPAKMNGKWGLWRNEKWMIKPIYDNTSVFQDGRATVTLGGVTFEIDRYGNKVQN